MKIIELGLPERIAFARQNLPYMYRQVAPRTHLLADSLIRLYLLPPATAQSLVDDYLENVTEDTESAD